MNRKMKNILVIAMLLGSIKAFADNPISTALNSSDRLAEDLETDKRRLPAKFMSFLDMQPGMKVLDVFSGGGYYTEIAARIVGESGMVHAHNNQAYVNYIGEEKIAKRYKDNRLPNVTTIIQEANSLALSEQYDRILLVLSFHDLFYQDDKNGWPKIDAPKFMGEIQSALKADGLIGIIDHAAEAGSDISTAQTLHRIAPEIIHEKMKSFGFTFVGESTHLRNKQDPLTVPMWEPSIRGKTDRIVYKYKVTK